MKTKIVKIGNSQGIRIPKPLLKEAGLRDDVEMTVEGNAVVIRAAKGPREGWHEAFLEMAKRGDDTLLTPETPTHFDEDDWEWK